MTKLAWSASLVSALALAACGGGGGEIILPDAGGGGGGNGAECNPVTQAGCAAGEKCSLRIPPMGTAGAATTECLPVGDKAAGETCTFNPDPADPTMTRFDDCGAGLACDGVCVQICAAGQAGSCTVEAEACVRINGFFADVGSGNDVGVCAPECDLLDPAAVCGATNGCYGLFETGESICANVAGGAENLTFKQPCTPNPDENPTGCFLNSAPIGGTPSYTEAYGGDEQGKITAWCSPIDLNSDVDPADAGGDPVGACGTTRLQTTQDGTGDPAQCRSLNTTYTNTTHVPADWGFCVDPADDLIPADMDPAWGNCLTIDMATLTDADPDNDTLVFPGCLTQATLNTLPAASRARIRNDMAEASPQQLRAFGFDFVRAPRGE